MTNTSNSYSVVGIIRNSQTNFRALIDSEWDNRQRVEIVWKHGDFGAKVPISVSPMQCVKCGAADACPESDNAETCCDCSDDLEWQRAEPYDNH